MAGTVQSLGLLWAACLACLAAAQSDLAFEWGFLNGESDFTECQSVAVQITDAKDSTEPYYMFTYPVNSSASPSFSTYGKGETNNMTVAPYSAGTDIVMGMVDAFGASGGWTGTKTVQDGGSGSCSDQVDSDTPITATLNTTEVGTCGTVGVTIKNGNAPYTITVFPIDSVATTFNITTSSSDNYLSFVNDLGANLHLGFGIRDNDMNWAKTAGPVWTFGTTQKCDTVSSTSNKVPSDDEGGDSSGPNNSPSDGSSGDSSGGSGGRGGGGGGGGGGTGAAVGGAVGGVAAAAIAGLLAAWWFGWCCFAGKRKQKQDAAEYGHDAPYYDHSPQPTPGVNSTLLNPYGQPSSAGSAGMPAGAAGNHSRTSLDTSNRPMSQVSSGYNQMSGFRLVNPDNADAQEALYPPSAAFAQQQSHSRHTSWDSQNNMSPQQQHYQPDDARRSHLPSPPSSSGGGNFMEGFEPQLTSQPQGDERPPMSVSEKAAAMMAESGPQASSSRRVHQHTDAGPAQQQDDEELPPAYAGIRPGQ